MKSQILHSYQLKPDEYIDDVLTIDEEHAAIFIKSKSRIDYIDIFREKLVKRISLETIHEYKSNFEFHVFTYFDDKIALLNFNNIIIWEDIVNTNEFKILKIQNPIKLDWAKRGRYPVCCSYSKYRNSLYFTIGDYGTVKSTTSVRELKLSKPIFSIKWEKSFFKWTGNYLKLPLDHYPETYLSSRQLFDELSIINILAKEDELHFHTKGGSSSRSKSGPYYEFSIIGVYDNKMNLKKVYEIEFGNGFYSSDKKFFIVHRHKGKNKLIFYKTENYEIFGELSLTPDQNLGDNKSLTIKAQLQGDKIIVYNDFFMNVCILKN